MKKLTAMFLILALALGALAVPALAGTTFSAGGIQAYPLRTEFNNYSGKVYLRVYMRLVNNSSHPVTILLKEVKVDGVSIYGAGVSGLAANTDTGNDSDEYFLFRPEYDTDTDAARALRDANTLTMTLHAFDSDTYDDIALEPFEINIPALGGSGDYDDDIDGLDFGHGGSSASYAPPYTPASYDFQTLKKGSRGQAVKDLQQRLTDLGYLNDKVDGSFGTVTGIAVMSFCDQNGLSVSAEATPEMQQLLYSSSAQYYDEPYIPLVIGTEYKWKSNASNDVGTFYIQLVNRSHRQIRGYEIYLYRTNMWDEKIYNDDGGWLYKYEEQQSFKPGQWQNSNPLIFGYFAYTYTVWAGIHKIVFDDGEIREVPYDDMEWFPCVVKNK